MNIRVFKDDKFLQEIESFRPLPRIGEHIIFDDIGRLKVIQIEHIIDGDYIDITVEHDDD